MKWLSFVLVLAGLPTAAWSAVLNLDLAFPSAEITTGTTVSFNLSGQFHYNSGSYDSGAPEVFTVQSTLYDGIVVPAAYHDLYATFKSSDIVGSLTASNASSSISPELVSIRVDFSHSPLFFGDPITYWVVTLTLDSGSGSFAFFDELTDYSDLVLDLTFSGQLELTAKSSHEITDLFGLMTGDFAGMNSDIARVETSVIPEPSATAVLAGFAALGLVAMRRQKREISPSPRRMH